MSLKQWFARRPPVVRERDINGVRKARNTFNGMSVAGDELRRAWQAATTMDECLALAAVAGRHALGLEMFDEQLAAALALARGSIVEMQTGEGKTLAAVPAAAWLARAGRGVHVLTANDYLAIRDAAWMSGVYESLGMSVGAISQTSTPEERRAAYRCDVTYATANDVGFDALRDGLALEVSDRVQRGFYAALIDEADSILIDEARVPLVIAGGASATSDLAMRADRAIRMLVPLHDFTLEQQSRNVLLTAAGIARVERATGCANLFDDAALDLHTAVQDALHAHVLLHRDVDYLVVDGAIRPVDEFKGRIVRERRWPAGLQTALETKEHVAPARQGRVLGSITVEHLIAQYTHVCGMTGTAATQAPEFQDVYGLAVEVIPPHLPVVREDLPDAMFATRLERDIAVIADIRHTHAAGRPVLVGTRSVEDSERLSAALTEVPHHVLNARHEATEAAIIARAGERHAVTISTNMAGRGVDIRLGEGVAERGGLHVIGTGRHESRRIDHQLRGRAGRQGDPGSSRFFVSRDDALMSKFADGDAGVDPDQLQRIAEGQNLDIRRFLRKYESVIEGQRQHMASLREHVLEDVTLDARERRVRLLTIDDLWSDYLAAIAELRSGTTWVSLGYGDPLGHYLKQVHTMFVELLRTTEEETASRLASTARGDLDAAQDRGATWTYITNDEPFGSMTTRIVRRIVENYRNRKARKR